ncbi:lipase/acylhydrolase family protein [Arcticibacter svalbardensis MN12-7]|uniref:Lipase/acylhydrolase family protein n=2 Tax=Arcticibacter TaxID=1288026 RepID=R9GUS7_9SPHI|nr:lipase/acylhydrolase family protein [Arcticibacter svalbardensis MN12-7]
MALVQPKKVFFFGDSITSHGPDADGFITLMQKRLKDERKTDQFELFGAGVPGNKVYDLFFRLKQDILDKAPDVVVIYIGINDVWHKAEFGTGTDEGRYISFYSSMIEILKSKGIRVILCTPSIIGEKKNFVNPQDGGLNQYSQIVRDLALKYECDLVDLRKAMVEYEIKNNTADVEKGVLTRDRVHMNATGNKFIADTMYPIIFK